MQISASIELTAARVDGTAAAAAAVGAAATKQIVCVNNSVMISTTLPVFQDLFPLYRTVAATILTSGLSHV